MANRATKGISYVGDIKPASGSIQKVLITAAGATQGAAPTMPSLARTNTTAKTLGTLPAGAIIIGLTVYAAAASNAATTATISLGKLGGTGTEYLNGYDVKTAGTGAGQNTPNGAVLGSVGTAAVTVTGIYAETGTASTSGGPWSILLEYVTI